MEFGWMGWTWQTATFFGLIALGSAFICLGWLAMFGSPLWWALLVCCTYAVAVFRWV